MTVVAYFVDVARADTLLDVGEAFAVGVSLSHKVRNKRMHARRGKQNRRVVFGNKACALYNGMPSLLKNLKNV